MSTLLRRCCLQARPLLGQLTLYGTHVRAARLQLRLPVQQWHQLSTVSEITAERPTRQEDVPKLLPWSCPGCGAFSQTDDAEVAGYFTTTRKSVREFVSAGPAAVTPLEAPDTEIPTAHDDSSESSAKEDPSKEPVKAPVCDRCHDLIHHNKGNPVEHPTLQALQAMFDETPHKHNHVYHVIDAADFPMSLIPRLHEKLDLSPQRSQNRRSKHAKFLRGRVAELSFIITRSDLLAPEKRQVDTLMPALTEILRKALGRAGRDIRLGNVRCVSGNRGWWTKVLKEEIWQRGGGGWMIGKVNVGKSKLFENILPKGRADQGSDFGDEPMGYDREQRTIAAAESNLLPPRPSDINFPVLPVVSSVSGTTAGPIRIPFGRGRGELIDLPGLSRGGLESFVKDEYKTDLTMTERVSPEQLTIKPGQSLIISDLIRISPKTDSLIFLASPFVSLKHHITNHEKAAEIQEQKHPELVMGIAKPEAIDSIASAGTFKLDHDVTRQRAGPLTARDAVGLDPTRLPFVVYATDILIEGVGWVEIACQVRRKQLDEIRNKPDFAEGDQYPVVEVFSPEGKYISQRQSLSAWLLGGHRKRLPVSRRKAMPRKSMKGQKKVMKRKRREAQV